MRGYRLLWTAVLLFATSSSLQRPAFGDTLTLVAAHQTEAELALLDLLTVELSSIPQLEMVERQSVRRLLEEQHISAFGEDSDSLLLGQLLGVDAFAVWEEQTPVGDADQISGRLVCFDGATGVRLGDHALSANDLGELARRAAEVIPVSVTKRGQFKKGELNLFAISSVRNVDVPSPRRERIPAMLEEIERAICNHPNSVLLERERLRFVLREQALPLAREQAHLLAAAQSLTLEFSQAGLDNTKVTVREHRASEPRPTETSWTTEQDETNVLQGLETVIARPVANRSSQSELAEFEATKLEQDARRLAAMNSPMAALIRAEASYLIKESRSSLFLMAMQLQFATTQEFGPPHAKVQVLHDIRHDPNGQRFPAPNDVTPAPEAAWLKLLDYLDYDLLISRKLSKHNPPPWSIDSEITRRGTIHMSFAYLSPKHHPIAMERARQHLQRFEEFVIERCHTVESMLNAETDETDALEWKCRLRILMEGHRFVMANWESQFLKLTRDASVQSFDRLMISPLRPTLAHARPEIRAEFFKQLDEAAQRQQQQVPLDLKFLQVNLLAHLGSQSQADELNKAARDLLQAAIAESDSKIGNYGTIFGDGAISVPCCHGRNMYLISKVFLLPGIREQKQLRTETLVSLLKHDIVHVDLLGHLETRNPEHRKLLESALEVMENDGSDYDEVSNIRIVKFIKSRLRVPSQPSQVRSLTQHVYPPYGVRLPKSELIGAVPAAESISVITKRHDDSKGEWIIEHVRLVPGGGVSIAGAVVFPNNIVEDYETRLKSQRYKSLIHPVNFFSMRGGVSQATADQEFIYVPTSAGGLLVFPIAGGPGTVVDESWGLPSNCVQALAAANGGVYAWTGVHGVEGNVVMVNVEAKCVRILAATQKEDDATPLNNLPGAECTGIVTAPDGTAVYFGVWTPWGQPRSGLWQLDCKTHQFSRFQESGHHASGLRGHKAEISFISYGNDVRKLVSIDATSQQATRRQIPVELTNLGQSPIAFYKSYTVWHNPFHSKVGIENRAAGKVLQLELMRVHEPDRLISLSPFSDGEQLLGVTNKSAFTVDLSKLIEAAAELE
ncbi:MAG: hypothetical protein R3C18_26550 [Planctomycetaceae bacterium]